MDSTKHFLLLLLQKLGAPLMRAVSAHPSENPDEEKSAQTLASLLSESVKGGIALSNAMNLKTDDGDADAIRVNLATLAGGLIANAYEQTGRVPSESDMQRVTKSLSSVIVFADNFAPNTEHVNRLKTLDGTPPFFDPVQTNIYAIHALLPVMAAISEFPFGMDETKLILDVAQRLGNTAKEIQSTIVGEENKMAELVILQALAQIYAGIHRAKTKIIRDRQSDGSLTIDSVWADFDKQKLMLEVLMKSVGGSPVGASSGSGSKGIKPAVEAPAAPESPPAAPPPTTPPAGGNPMSFFKKK